MPLQSVTIDELTVVDEASFGHVAVYAQLKRALTFGQCQFRVPTAGSTLSWDRATFLNLTYWSAAEGSDVLCEPSLPADVVAHVAWHHLAAAALARLAPGSNGGATALALAFGESIASAFDLYLVGRLLRNAPDSAFIESQVPLLGEAAEQAGLAPEQFTALLESVVDDPERAFEELRQLLFDVTGALVAATDAAQAHQALERCAGHRFEPLLHHFQLSNWVLYARAYQRPTPEVDRAVRQLDATLRAAPVALDWLIANWL